MIIVKTAPLALLATIGSRLLAPVFLLLAALAMLLPGAAQAQFTESGWTAHTPIPSPRGQAATAVDDLGRIYVFGGYTNGTAVGTNYRFSPGTPGTWVTLSAMPVAVRGASAVFSGGKIYVFGGATSSSTYSHVQAYTVASDSWTDTALTGLTWENAAAVTSSGRIFVSGGEGADSSLLEFTPPATLTSRATMLSAHNEHGAATFGTKFYVFGGYRSAASAAVESYDPTTNAWSTQAALPAATTQFAYAASASFLYVLGGSTAYGNYGTPVFSTTYSYDPVGNTWAAGPNLPSTSRESTAAVVGARLYLFGGGNTSAASAAVYSIGIGVQVPTVTGTSPASGFVAGGTALTITGTNFTGATTVTIGGTAATNVTVVNDTTITCTTPVGVAGAANVLVTTPGGTNAANTLYTYVQPVTIHPLNDSDPRSANLNVSGAGNSIRGWRFRANANVTVHELGSDNPLSAGSAFTLVLWSVTGPTQLASVTTTSTGSNSWQWVSLSTPVQLTAGSEYIVALHSVEGLYYYGSSLPAVWYPTGDIEYLDMRYDNGTPASTYPTYVLSGYQYGVVDIGYYGDTPTVSSPTATSSTGNLLASAATMTISGTGFDAATPGNNTVVFNDGAVGTVTAATTTQLTVTFSTRPVSAGSLTAVVTTPSGNSGTAVQVATVIPVVTFASASQTTAVTTVTINGLGFAAANANNSVLFNLGAVGSVTSSSPTQLSITFSSRPTSGNLTTVVTSNSQSSGAAVQVATIVPPVVATTAAVDAPSSTTPGTAIAGASWESIRSGMVMSGTGPLAYRGHMALSGGVTANDFQGIWKTPDGTAASSSLVARSGVTLEPSVGALFDILPFNPIINNAAQTSFIGMLRVNSGTPAVTTSSDSGVWSELGTGGLKKLLREGDTLSGSTVGTVAPSTWIAGSANAAAFGVKLGSGSALVRVDVAGSVATPSIVAAQGDTAPVKTGGDAGAFDTFVGNTSDPRMDAAGNVAFLNTVLPAGQGIWYKTVAGALTAVANTSQTAPGQGGPVFTGFERPSLSGDGSTIAFRAFLSGASGQSVFKGSVTAPVAIAKSNDTAITGMPAGRKLWSIWSPFTNNTGKVAFRVSLVDTATNANESRAILTDANGTLSVIAKVGDVAPGLGAQTFANFDHPIIGDGNQCAFIAATNAGTVGLFRQAAGGGALVLVTMVGDVVSLTGGGTDTIAQMIVPGTATDDRKYETKAIDTAGRILVHVTYASGRTGIFLSAP